MDAEYVKGLVEEAVIEGLTAAVKTQPEDAVDFLGKYLLNYAHHMESRQKAKVAAEAYKIQAEREAKHAEAERAAAEEAAANAPAVLIAKAEDAITSMLEGVTELNAATLSQLSNAVKGMVGASACYVAELMGSLPAPGEEPAEGAAPCIKYIGASEGQDFLLATACIRDFKAPTFKAFVMPEVPPPEEPAEGEEPKPAPPPPELPVVSIEDVLREEAVTFHGIPRPGAYVAAPLQYNTAFHSEAVPADHAPANAEDGSLTIPAPAPKMRNLAVCVDSLGQNRKFSAEEVAALKRVSNYLKAAAERTEKPVFEAEYRGAYGPKDEAATAADAEATAATEAANKAAEDETAAETAAAGEAAPEDVKALIKATASLKAARAALDVRAKALADFAAKRVPPREAALKVLQAAYFAVGGAKETLADAGAVDPKAADWSAVAGVIGPDFVAKLKDFDATQPLPKPLSYHKADAVRGLLEGLEPAELAKVSPALPVLVNLTKAILEVREASAAKRKREAEEAEAKAKAEAEAKAAAEAAAAEGGAPAEE